MIIIGDHTFQFGQFSYERNDSQAVDWPTR